MKHGKKTSNLVLLIMGVFLLAFIICMITIFCVKGSVPDTLIQCIMGAGGVEALTYDPEADAYICSKGKLLHKTGVRSIRTSTGYVSEKTVYECANCAGCPCKEKCIRSKSKAPLEERGKRDRRKFCVIDNPRQYENLRLSQE